MARHPLAESILLGEINTDAGVLRGIGVSCLQHAFKCARTKHRGKGVCVCVCVSVSVETGREVEPIRASG